MESNSNFSNMPSRDNRPNSSEDYLQRAALAANSGNKTLAIHLYLAAFEQSLHENIVPSNDALAGIDTAWNLAIETKQRSLAEYIFERLEPFWSTDVINKRAGDLQTLALDKLEEFGFPREALEGVAEFMNQDISALMPGITEQFSLPNKTLDVKFENPSSSQSNLDKPAFPTSFDSASSSNSASSADEECSSIQKQVSPAESSTSNNALSADNNASPAFSFPNGPIPQIIIPAKKNKKPVEKKKPEQPRFNYSYINGFDSVVSDMRKLGVGRKNDPEFNEFIKSLNLRHGMATMPSLGTLIFSCPAREDANYFMVATVGEMEIPAVRMRLDQNAQGQAVLCVMSSSDFKQKVNTISQSGFTSPAVVILEDLDLWDLPVPEFSSDNELFNLAQMQLTRGAREALALCKAALENPEVTVFISAQNVNDIDPFFMNMMNFYRVVEMDLPNETERRKCWRAAQSEHPSMRGLDVNHLVRYSKGMSRFEIFAVSNEVVEDAYRASLASSTFKAVHTEDIIARLANFQPLGSPEYQEMEDFVVSDFKRMLDDFSVDDLLD